jgi:hypothetical protein
MAEIGGHKMKKKDLIRIIKEEYENRLLQLEIAATIAEAELTDKRGNIIITKDLKVRHKASGYEYTVDQINGEGDDMVIFLRKPDAPRIDPPSVMKRMNELEGDGLIDPQSKSSEIQITNIETQDNESIADLENQELSDIFTVTTQEFKKDYIVD